MTLLLAGVALLFAGLFTCMGLLEQVDPTEFQYRFLYPNETKHFTLGLVLILIGQACWLAALLRHSRRPGAFAPADEAGERERPWPGDGERPGLTHAPSVRRLRHH